MSRVLLVYQTPTRRELYPHTLPPLGMLHVTSYLESKGIQADVIDCHVQKLEGDLSEYSAVFFAVNSANITNTIETIKKVKAENRQASIVVGGPLGRRAAAYYLTIPEIDAVILGEGEQSAYEYLTAEVKSKVKGLVLRNAKGKVFFTRERTLLHNLDELPFPALDKVPLKNYNMVIKRAHPISQIITSRGCPNRCIFCSHSSVWRQRSASHVVAEIEWQVDELGVKELAVNDDNFTLNRQRVLDICEGIIERGIRVKWQLKNGIRADKVDYELLKKMQEAGLWLVSIAPETGSLETLRNIQKNFSFEDVRNVVRWCKDLGLVTFSFFLVGFPWETRKNLEETVAFSRELDTDLVQFARILPLEGTPLYEQMALRPLNEFEETGFLHGGMKHDTLLLSPEEIHEFIRSSNRSHYLNPGKMLRLSRILRARDILSLAKYTYISRSI